MNRRESNGTLEERLERARAYFRDHHAGVEPDAGFADRVTARLDHTSSELLGWAAWRLLPATVVLTALLLFLSLRADAPSPTVALQDTADDDLLTWVLEEPENGS